LEDEDGKLPQPAGVIPALLVRFTFYWETSDARQLCRSVLWASVPGGDYWKLQFCRLGKGEGLLFARIVPRIDIVELQGGASVNLNNDFARGHRVMVHVRVEIGKAAGGE
jgi:hypothetical protein